MTKLYESDVEEAAFEWLAGIGYMTLHGPDIAPEEPVAEHQSCNEIILSGRLRDVMLPKLISGELRVGEGEI